MLSPDESEVVNELKNVVGVSAGIEKFSSELGHSSDDDFRTDGVIGRYCKFAPCVLKLEVIQRERRENVCIGDDKGKILRVKADAVAHSLQSSKFQAVVKGIGKVKSNKELIVTGKLVIQF